MKSSFITREGYERLQKELDHLWRVERPEVTRIVTWAAGLGDRSENADYQYNKRRLREIDRRVRFLRKTFETIKVVDYDVRQEGTIFFGAWVEVEDDEGEKLSFRIVGPDEIYGMQKYISLDSPMARACLGKQVDDEIIVNTPSGVKVWYVLNISYLSA